MASTRSGYLASHYGSPQAGGEPKKKKRRRKKKVVETIRVHDDEEDAWAAPSASEVNDRWDNWTTKEEAPVVIAASGARSAAAPSAQRARHDTPSPLIMEQDGSGGRQRHDTPSPVAMGAGDPPRERQRRQRHDSSSDESDSSSSSSSSSNSSARARGRGEARRVGRRARHDSPPPSPAPAAAAVPAAVEAAGAPVGRQARPTMAGGRSAGLQSGEMFAREGAASRAKAKAALRAQGPSSSQSETVYRDAAGKILAVTEKERDVDRLRRGELTAAEKTAEEFSWGRGAVQKAQRAAKAEELRKASEAPFAHRTGDADLEGVLKDKLREGDPMAQYVEEQRAKRTKKEERRRRKALKQAGGAGSGGGGGAAAAAAAAPPLRAPKPRYRGPARLPHRFGAVPEPGYRWDGVDRGNGFEARVMGVANSRSIASLKDYRYRSSDM